MGTEGYENLGGIVKTQPAMVKTRNKSQRNSVVSRMFATLKATWVRSRKIQNMMHTIP